MTEKIFDSKFHKAYVGGEGEVVEVQPVYIGVSELRGSSYEDVLREYRWYMRDPQVELPTEILEHLAQLGKIQL